MVVKDFMTTENARPANSGGGLTEDFFRDIWLRQRHGTIATKMEQENQKLHGQRNSWYSRIVLGLIVAATGVGAGDLITASLAMNLLLFLTLALFSYIGLREILALFFKP